jgi:hypothetical protein
MYRTTLKKTFTGLLLLAVVLQPLLLVAPETAQAISFGAASNSVVAAGIGCEVQNLLQRKLSGALPGTIGSEIEQETGISLAVQVVDKGTRDNTKATANKLTCLQKVARAAVQVVLRELTKETVNWINGGFNGQPLYIRNPKSFFKSVADQEVGGLAKTFSDSTKYPFGNAFIRGYIQSTQLTLERQAQYSLNGSLGGYTSVQFYNNFNNGGWKAWEASILPQNNPLGFAFMASDVLETRLTGTTQSKAQDTRDELNQSGGFLSQKICADPIGYKPPTNSFATMLELEEAFRDPNTGAQTKSDAQILASYGLTEADVDMCKRSETTTPGGVVASKLTYALDSGRQNLIIAPEDLDASLQAVFDALTSQLFNMGLSSLSDLANGSQGSSATVTSTGGYGDANNTSTVPTSPTANTNLQWFDQNPQFDISHTADIDHIITTQNLYLKAIVDDPTIAAPALNPQSNAYPSAAVLGQNQKGQNYWLGRIIPEIYQLDYCIPGPHPGWENDTQSKVSAIESEIKDVSSYNDTANNHALAQLYDSVTFGIPHTIINVLTNIVSPGDINADDYAKMKYYGAIIAKNTGIIAKRDNYIGTREKTITILNTLLERFIAAVNTRFSYANLPSVAGEAATFFGKIGGYQTIADKNNQDIITLQGVVRRLGELKDQVTALNAQIANQTITQAEYQNSIDFAKRSFASLTPNLVTENDIQIIHNQIQEMQSDLVYIHNTLLKGLNGCEAQIHLVPPHSRVRAFPYPAPHFYDYPPDNGGSGSVDLNSLGIDSQPDTLLNGGPVRAYGTYYPFMIYAYFGTPGGADLSSYADWIEVHITDIMNFDEDEVSPTVNMFEAKIGPLW